MNLSEKQITVSTVLLASGLAAGAFFRFLLLGTHPLDNSEATLALQAFQTSRSTANVSLGGHPFYLIGTTILFYFFGDSNFLARLIPALAGTMLVIAPVFYQKYLNKGETVVLVLLLAIEPALVAASRMVGSEMLVLTLVVYTFTAIVHKRMRTAAVLFGLTLLSGPTVWLGLVVIILSGALWVLICKPDLSTFWEESIFRKPLFWIISAVVTLLTSTAFLLIPNGLSTFSSSFVDFLSYWTNIGTTPILLVLLAFPFYSPLVLFAGLIGMGLSIKKRIPVDLFFTIMSLIAFILVLVLPGRNLMLLIWVSLPLTVLAARQIAQCVLYSQVDDKQTLLIAGFVILIMAFLWQVFGTLNQGALDMNNFLLYLGAGVVILLVCAILAILGWSIRVAGTGYAWGFIVVATVFTLMASWRGTGNSDGVRMEFWNAGIEPAQVELLASTVEEISDRVRGVPNGLDIVVLGDMQPSVAWELRNQPTKQVEGLINIDQPAMVLTSSSTQLEMVQAYRGQDFVIQSGMDWEEISVQGWLKWIMIRKSNPTPQQSNILWVRADLFPGYRSTTIISE